LVPLLKGVLFDIFETFRVDLILTLELILSWSKNFELLPIQLIFSLRFIVHLTFTWKYPSINHCTFNSLLARIHFTQSIHS
jgi:hypothetical protein